MIICNDNKCNQNFSLDDKCLNIKDVHKNIINLFSYFLYF